MRVGSLLGPETDVVLASEDDIGHVRRNILGLFLTVAAAVNAALCAVTLVRVMVSDVSLTKVLGDVLALLVYGGLWRLSHSGRTALASWLLFAFVIVGATAFFAPGEREGALIIYAIPVVGAAFLTGPRTSLVITAVSVGFYTAAWYAGGAAGPFNFVFVAVLAALSMLSLLTAEQWEDAIDMRQQCRRELDTWMLRELDDEAEDMSEERDAE